MSTFLAGFNYHQLWQPQGLFAIRPPVTWNFQWAYVGFVGICFLGACVFSFLTKLPAKVRSRYLVFTWTEAILGAMLYFFRQQQIPYLGMDIFRSIQEITAFFWLLWVIISSRGLFRHEKIQQAVQERREKYLPKTKD